MAHATSPGEIRPTLTHHDLYFLNRALTGCDAVAALIEGAISHPESVTPTRLAILAESLREAADTLDPRRVHAVGGRHHD